MDVWYPADPGAEAQPAEYLPDMAILNKKFGPEAMLVSPIKGHALAAPPIAAGANRFPVLVFSPGMGTNGSQYAFLVEELVSHGYLVATIDHPFQSRAIAYPDGRIVTAVESPPESDPVKYAENYRKTIELRARDVRFVLDQLKRLNAGELDQRFAQRLDLFASEHSAIRAAELPRPRHVRKTSAFRPPSIWTGMPSRYRFC